MELIKKPSLSLDIKKHKKLNPLITTIIPTFQRPALLKKSILSVLNQTYPHFRVCVYDNASDEETRAIVKKLQEDDPRIIYHRHKNNIGMMANYEFALSRIKTRFFSLLSDDDFLLPSFFETALRNFQAFPKAAFSACGVKALNETGDLISYPLYAWKREGYFIPVEGMLEMICKPLLPIGILFNHELVKKIEIDFSKEAQLRWDSDYLLQIASRLPFVVKKDIHAVFLAHGKGFSTSQYRKMQECSELFQTHLLATQRMETRLLQTLNPFPSFQKQAIKAFLKDKSRAVTSQINPHLGQRTFSHAWKVIEMYRQCYGVDRVFFSCVIKIWLSENIPLIGKIFRVLKKIKKRQFFL